MDSRVASLLSAEVSHMRRRNLDENRPRRLDHDQTDRLLLDATIDELVKLALQVGISIRDLTNW